jgi:hypothetical protein
VRPSLEPSAFAREGYEPLEAAAVAAKARKAPGEDAADDEPAKLALDERREAGAIEALAGALEKGAEVLARHSVEQGGLGISWLVHEAPPGGA